MLEDLTAASNRIVMHAKLWIESPPVARLQGPHERIRQSQHGDDGIENEHNDEDGNKVIDTQTMNTEQ